jgi:hypothetical protein
MKYELEPDNRNCTDDVLLEDLREIAKQLGKQSLTKDDYNEHGRFCAAAMQKRFGSWNKALVLSGLTKSKRMNIPKEELLDDLGRVASELGLCTITQEDYGRYGKFSYRVFSKRFGGWSLALAAARLKPTVSKSTSTTEDLLENMAAVWERLGRQPRKSDFGKSLSRFGPKPYLRIYGSWRNALEAFVLAANAGGNVTPPKTNEKKHLPSLCSSSFEPLPLPVSSSAPVVNRRTSRSPSWRLQHLVMKRDHFACQNCGAAPAKNPAVNLHLDHKNPWSKGGETTFDNLVTLCSVCNGGKSDLLE